MFLSLFFLYDSVRFIVSAVFFYHLFSYFPSSLSLLVWMGDNIWSKRIWHHCMFSYFFNLICSVHIECASMCLCLFCLCVFICVCVCVCVCVFMCILFVHAFAC